MKKILCFLLCLFLTLPILSSCSKPPEYAEIEARFRELVEASHEINTIFFGEGLPTYSRMEDPRSSTDIYTHEENGNQFQYYELTDEALGRIVAFRAYADTKKYTDESTGKKYYYYQIWDETYGRVMIINSVSDDHDFYLEIEDEPREGEEPYYSDTEKGSYGYLVENYSYTRDYTYTYVQVKSSAEAGREIYYERAEENIYCYLLTDYTEPAYEFFYDSEDPEDYDYVRAESKYYSISDIKAAAEKVYSTEYLTSIYDSVFVGTVSDVANLKGLSARFIEYADQDDGTVSLMQSNTFEPLIRGRRLYDYSTARIVKPANKKYVTIELESYLEGNEAERLTVKISMILQDGVWMLDSATY